MYKEMHVNVRLMKYAECDVYRYSHIQRLTTKTVALHFGLSHCIEDATLLFRMLNNLKESYDWLCLSITEWFLEKSEDFVCWRCIYGHYLSPIVSDRNAQSEPKSVNSPQKEIVNIRKKKNHIIPPIRVKRVPNEAIMYSQSTKKHIYRFIEWWLWIRPFGRNASCPALFAFFIFLFYIMKIPRVYWNI